MGLEECISVLKLSNLWAFAELRDKVADELSMTDINPVEMIMLAREYKVEILLVQGYVGLTTRNEGPSVEEAKRLGNKTTVRLYGRRELYWKHKQSCTDLDGDIREMFEEELNDIKYHSEAIQGLNSG